MVCQYFLLSNLVAFGVLFFSFVTVMRFFSFTLRVFFCLEDLRYVVTITEAERRSTMRIHCPHCGVKGSLDDKFAGRKIQCPKCKEKFVAGAELPSSQDKTTTIAQDVPLHNEVDNAQAKEQALEDTEAFSALSARGRESIAEELASQPEPDARMAGTEPPRPLKANTEGTEDSVVPAMPPRSEDAEKYTRDHEEQEYTSRDFTIGEVLSDAWDLVSGVKMPINIGLFITYGVSALIITVLTYLLHETGSPEGSFIDIIVQVANSALSILFTAGLMFMGVKRATDRVIVWKDVLSGFDVTGKILIAGFLQGALIILGFMLLVLPGIYLMIGYIFSFALILDKQMSPWQAMETSRKAVHKVWWKIFALYLIILIIVTISAIPMGIGLIWTGPLSVILCGVVYSNLFSIKKKS